MGNIWHPLCRGVPDLMKKVAQSALNWHPLPISNRLVNSEQRWRILGKKRVVGIQFVADSCFLVGTNVEHHAKSKRSVGMKKLLILLVMFVAVTAVATLAANDAESDAIIEDAHDDSIMDYLGV